MLTTGAQKMLQRLVISVLNSVLCQAAASHGLQCIGESTENGVYCQMRLL